MLAAQVPDAPTTVTTSVNGLNVDVSWTAPFDQGSPILSYIVKVQSNSLDFNLELSHCDGSDNTISTATLCSIPISELRKEPHNLPWGSSVHVEVIA